MKLFFCSLFLFLLPFSVLAQDYDAFVLNYQSVQAHSDKICVEFVFEQPKKHKIDTALKNGAILKLVFDMEVAEKKFLRSTTITTASFAYYLRYDPLTRQYTAMQESKTIARNSDANFLLNVLIQHVSVEIPCALHKNSKYVLRTLVDLSQSNARTWLGTNMLVGPDKIIQPLEFEYEFSL